jgi:2'-5' RNA ligase
VIDVPSGAGPIDSFALVTYLPDPLGEFLDKLRHEFEPGCLAQSHLTVLPPRPLGGSPDAAWQDLKGGLEQFRPFDVQLTQVEVFPVTDVVYIAIGEGQGLLKEMHDALSRGRLAFTEPFHYHPHVTIAQDLAPEQIPEAVDTVRNRWAEFSHSRRFSVSSFTFVQNTEQNCWMNLSECQLKEPLMAPSF